MPTIFHGRYNQNDLRNYPLADGAARGGDGGELPIDFLVDAAIRYPNIYEGTPYVASATLSDTLVTVVLSLRTAAGDVPLGWVNLTNPANQQYKLTKLIPLTKGVNGWVVFGNAVRKKTPFRATFPDAAQTELLPRVARSYRTPAVRSISRVERKTRLEGHVTLAGGNNLQVIQADQDWAVPPDYNVFPRAMRVVDGIKRAGLVVRLSSDLSESELAAYLGVCFDVSSLECDPPVIKSVNRVLPDAAGNIDVIITGIPTKELMGTDGTPEGVVVEMPIGLIDVCDNSKDLDPTYKPQPECD